MTMTNLEWIAKKDIRAGNAIRCSDFGNWMAKNHFGEDVDYWFVKWLDMEHVEPILDDVEKRYLSAVIRPFRDRVDWIVKVSDDDLRRYHIQIHIDTNGFSVPIKFPCFDGDEMYKGMKPDREYTLKELGL